jgi:hypothetical protein
MLFGHGINLSQVLTQNIGYSLHLVQQSVCWVVPPLFLTLTIPIHLTVINNHRVLHGRSAFDGKRRMCGAYIGMDEYRSKLSVLSEKFATESSTDTLDANPDERSSWDPVL